LIVSVLLIGGWIGWVARSARIQHDAVLAIEKAGGMAGYDWQWKNDHWVSRAKPWAPDWLVKPFGADYFGDVIVVFVSMQRAPDDLFTHIENLSHLQVLFFSDSVLTDADLDHLKNLLSLRNLQLTRSGPRGGVCISDAGIDRLKGLTNLEHLGLAGTQITDAGLVCLKGKTKLADLGLEDTAITDAGLVHLQGLTNLSDLDLSGTQITDAGLKNLRPLTRLGLCSHA
jgi:Leucine Rich repeat